MCGAIPHTEGSTGKAILSHKFVKELGGNDCKVYASGQTS